MEHTTTGLAWPRCVLACVIFAVLGCADRGPDPTPATGALELRTANREYRLTGVLELVRLGLPEHSTSVVLDGDAPSTTVLLAAGSYRAMQQGEWRLERLSSGSAVDITDSIATDGIVIEPNPAIVEAGVTTALAIDITLEDDSTVVFAPGAVSIAINVDDTSDVCRACAADDRCLVQDDGVAHCAQSCDPDGDVESQCGGGGCVPFTDAATGEPLYVCDPVIGLTAGGLHTCALRLSGAAACWGDAYGLGRDASSPTPVAVSDLLGATQMDAGVTFSCALRQDGTIACWGQNDVGQLGSGETTGPIALSAVPVHGIAGATSIGVGYSFACATLESGEVACWGHGGNGQLGIGEPMDFSSVPLLVPGITDATAVSAGLTHACALRSGSVDCWGDGYFGQLGNGAGGLDAVAWTPVTVLDLTDAVQLSAGYHHTCALRENGTVSCWGGASLLGDGSSVDSPTPVQVSGITDAVAISAGGYHTCAVRAGGTIACWGYQLSGQLGIGVVSGGREARYATVPVQVLGITNAVAVDAGGAHTCALEGDGVVDCWGVPHDGRLGSTPEDPTLPNPVISL